MHSELPSQSEDLTALKALTQTYIYLHLALHPGPQAAPAVRRRKIPVSVFPLGRVGSRKQDTYSHNEEVQPAPGVGEELDETIGCPLEQHLQDEDIGEDFVSVLQDGPDGPPLLNVDVLEGLKERQQLPVVPKGKQALPSAAAPPTRGWPIQLPVSSTLLPGYT